MSDIDRKRAMWRERAARGRMRLQGIDTPFQKPGPRPDYCTPSGVVARRAAAIREQWTTRKQPLEDRFWAMVDKSGECWTWKGARLPKGYGRFQLNDRSCQAHRIAYEIAFGPFDPTLQVLHRCDNPPCVRPDHLFLGTNADNVADKVAKNRQARNFKKRP